jgi:hypothetical protein
MPRTTDDLVGTREAALILDRNPVTITRWAADGILPVALKLPGRNGALVFHRTDVEALRDQLAAAHRVAS